MSEFFNWWIIIIVAINILGCWALLYWTRKMKAEEGKETTGHVFDGIEEYNKPLPRWWLNMFYITLVFGVIYLALYPGLGNFPGMLGWTQQNQHAEEVADAKVKYQPLFDKYANTPISELAKINQATEMGKRIFINNCAVCHGSDARGNKGYPNLTDDDWLWGSSAEQIKHSILNGRIAAMPAFEAAFSAEQVDELVHYVGQLSGNAVDTEKASRGAQTFTAQCSVCHGAEGKGKPAMGAPNLTDNIWLYGGSKTTIAETIRQGRNGQMPAQKQLLGDAKVHLVSAYVYSLSKE